ncbi:MAG: histidinol-phosphatase HisJ family protein [Verrucomicrobiota bacterium]|nr:histidinol-phosphatase HisJ family protein [Verrucomicrobiota bacterium]
MQLTADYHMHTPLCRHAVGEPTELAAHAVKIGLPEIGFSDHSPMRRDDFDNWRMSNSQLDEYVEKVRAAQNKFPQLAIKLALEVDYLPGHEEWISELATRHPWDYFIGSVHYISNALAVDDPTQISKLKEHDPMGVWTAYFDRLTLAAASGLFEIIGHADLPKKFRIYPKEDCSHLFEKFLNACAKSNTAIELNTAGLRKDCREIYPSRQILQMAFQKNVAITFGSDAHAPEEVGMNFAAALQLAREVGYTHSRRFTQRRGESFEF